MNLNTDKIEENVVLLHQNYQSMKNSARLENKPIITGYNSCTVSGQLMSLPKVSQMQFKQQIQNQHLKQSQFMSLPSGSNSLVNSGVKTRATTAHNTRPGADKSFLKRRKESILRERLDISNSLLNNTMNQTNITIKSRNDLSDNGTTNLTIDYHTDQRHTQVQHAKNKLYDKVKNPTL